MKIYALASVSAALTLLLFWARLDIDWRLVALLVLLAPAAAVLVAGPGMIVAAMVLPWGTCWASPTADVVATVWKWTRRPVVHAGNLGAYPQGEDKTGPFLTALCRDATDGHLTVRARAGSHGLFTKLYQGHGFVIVGDPDARHPKIERRP